MSAKPVKFVAIKHSSTSAKTVVSFKRGGELSREYNPTRSSVDRLDMAVILMLKSVVTFPDWMEVICTPREQQ